MQQLSLRKRLAVIRLFLDGLSYDEMATRTGVSKGAVANIVADLRTGRILDVQGPADQLDLLRELAVDLRRLKLTPSQAVVGVAALSHLQELEIEPADIQSWAAVYRDLAASESDRQAFVKAALYVEQLRQSTGLTPEDLEAKAHSLQQEVAHLEPLAQEVREYEQQLPELRNQRQTLADEISQLEKRNDQLLKGVAQKDTREAELSHRTQKLEQKAQEADERLAAARKDLKELAGLGLSLDDLPGFVHRLSAIAQRHGMNHGALRDRLLQELETLDAVVGLEDCLKRKQDEVNDVEQAIVKARQERKSEDHALKKLRQQQANLHAVMTEEETHVRKEMQGITGASRNAATKLTQDLANAIGEALLEVRKLTSESFQLGQELGRHNAIVEANQWLETLVALVKGGSVTSAGDVRAVGLAVLRGLKVWMEQNPSQLLQAHVLPMQVNAAMGELERWKT
jgi:predicted  nucleic acid-binding Zn-ribbon protein